MLWKYETGLGIASSPAVSGNFAAVASKDGFLYAFDLPAGHLRWKTNLAGVVTATPTIAEGAVCIQAGGTFALDVATGKIVWRAELGGAIQSVPVLTADTIFLASLSGEIYALQ